MALLPPIPGARLTQGFGPSRLSVEPAMFASETVAYWQDRPGLDFYPHFHPAQDLAAPLGTPILASEAGVIDFAGIVYVDGRPNGGGLVVRLKIRDNVWIEHSHCSSYPLPVGRSVARGAVIARVGSTGLATGDHDHWSVLRRLVNQGVATTYMYDPAIFLPGGSHADADWIRPPGAIVSDAVRLKGPGINIRTSPDLDVGPRNIFASSSESGIYSRNGLLLAPLSQRMHLYRYVSNDDGKWAEVWLAGGHRFVFASLTVPA